MKTLINKHQKGSKIKPIKRVKTPNETNVKKIPIVSSDKNGWTSYQYRDPEGFKGTYTEYNNGTEKLSKYRTVWDPKNSTGYQQHIRQKYVNGIPVESDTVYHHENGRPFTTISKSNSPKQYNYLQNNIKYYPSLEDYYYRVKNFFNFKQGGKLIPKHQQGGSLTSRGSRVLDYFRDNALPYLEWVEARKQSGKNWDNYTWTGKPVREYDNSGDPASYNPYLTTMVPVKNSQGQNGFLEINPYFFGGYQETFHPENVENSRYPNIKKNYDELMKSGWNSREYAKTHEYHPLTNYHKQGGHLSYFNSRQENNKLLKYQAGGTVNLTFGREYFDFPKESLTPQQLEFINRYNDEKYSDPWFISDEDEYNFYKDWEQNFGSYEPSNSTYGGYYVDDSGSVKRAKYNNNQWSVDTTKYKVYTTPLNYSKENGYYFKVGDKVYKGGRYR